MNKLYRSERDKKIAGVCGGLAEVFNIDANLLRLIVIITAFFSAGTVVLLYIIACFVIPKEPVSGPYSIHSDQGYHHTYSGPQHQKPYGQSSVHDHNSPGGSTSAGVQEPTIDDMMKDIEKKALQKEIEELRAKVAKLEKGE